MPPRKLLGNRVTMSDTDDADRAHLSNLEDGCGCAEVWEHLSESREE
jgi:hypothetical protein